MASGMAAVTMIAELIKPGENIVITKEVYGGTTRFFSEIAPKRGIEVYFCDFYDTDKLNSLINDKTKLVWIESPSNPNINLYDFSKIADIDIFLEFMFLSKENPKNKNKIATKITLNPINVSIRLYFIIIS